MSIGKIPRKVLIIHGLPLQRKREKLRKGRSEESQTAFDRFLLNSLMLAERDYTRYEQPPQRATAARSTENKGTKEIRREKIWLTFY